VSTLLTVLTSAAVGVLVSGAVTLWGQYLERGARRKELLFAKSLEVAKRRNEMMLQTNRERAILSDEVVLAGLYYGWLKELFESGELPPEAKKSPSYVFLIEAMSKSFKSGFEESK
jgi:ABC-type amino acid transport substrate-binding protein